MKKVSLYFIAWLSSLPLAVAAVPNDFDGDGISDRVRVEIESDKTLTWTAQLSVSQSTTALGSVGSVGDAVIMGQWLPGGTQIGVASLNEASGDIVWTIRDDAGELHSFTFGTRGDVVVSGADFDGSGIADAAIVRLEDGKARWLVRLDPFTTETPTEKSLLFGKAGDRVFYARAQTGSVRDWIGVVRKGARRKSLARMKNIMTGSVRQFTNLPGFASEGTRPRPFPIRQSDGTDLLGFSLTVGGQTALKVYSLSGAPIASIVRSGDGTTVVGEFLQGAGHELLYESGDEAVIVNPRDLDVTEATALGGIAVDEININGLGSVMSVPPPKDEDDNSGGGGDGPTQCGTILPWPKGYVYKTIGSTHFHDVRRNTIGVLLRSGARGPYPSCVDALDRDGRVVAKLALFARGDGWEGRYYAGIKCARSTPYNGEAVAARARAKSGSSKIYMKFDNVCYGPIEASRCIASRQC